MATCIYEYACSEMMQLTVVWGGVLDLAFRLAGAARKPFIMTTGTQVWTLSPSSNNDDSLN